MADSLRGFCAEYYLWRSDWLKLLCWSAALELSARQVGDRMMENCFKDAALRQWIS